VLGDCGVGRKELLIRLASSKQGAVLRVDADLTVYPAATPDGLLLADALARQPWRGEVECYAHGHADLDPTSGPIEPQDETIAPQEFTDAVGIPFGEMLGLPPPHIPHTRRCPRMMPEASMAFPTPSMSIPS
jgi:hypothetical protein